VGHHGQIKAQYRDLARRLEASPVSMPEPQDPHAWQGWKDILEILFSPEQAELAARLPVMPSSLDKIARRLKTNPAELRPQLDAMCDKGLVLDLVHPRTGQVKYLLSPPVVGFFEFSLMRAKDDIPKKRMAEALEAYTHFDEAFCNEVFGHDTVVGRALVHENALGENAAEASEVLDWERATSVVTDARSVAVSLCYCRHKAEHLGTACEAPQEVCLSLNGGADFVLRHEFGRAIEQAEALDILAQSRDLGLVQIADNVKNRPAYICNCCGCCCGQLQSINQYDLQGVNPSGFQPVCSDDQCNGCSRCGRACPVTAITMTAGRRTGNLKNDLRPAVDADRCLGCGVCATACTRGAIKMERGGNQRHIPANAIERSLRSVIENGRLGYFLFDEGAGRGHKFLNRVCRTLNDLPGAQKVLASEQVSSRFLKAVLSGVRDPGT
jgi:Pyruvate/2-oxoacid:ferredoxin oxidoreductase delta subunit